MIAYQARRQSEIENSRLGVAFVEVPLEVAGGEELKSEQVDRAPWK
jgi:hypothetical protein